MTRIEGSWRARSWLAGLAIVLTCAVGCRPEEESTHPARPPKTVRLAVANVRATDRPVRASADGVVTARHRSVISARLTATVAAVNVREGDRVVAGQELIRLDDRDPVAVSDKARAAIREAAAGVDEASRAESSAIRSVEAAAAATRLAALTRARLVQLFLKGGVSAQARDEAIARDDTARAELARSREALAAARARREQAASRVTQSVAESKRAAVGQTDTRLLAPFAGVIATRPVDPGTLASPGVPLVTLEDGDPRLECLVPATWIDRVHVGDAVPVELDSPAERVSARVDEITPNADPRTHTVLVRLALPPGSRRRSGSYGRATFVIASRPSLTVPGSAVLTRGQVDLVFVVDAAGTARLRIVRTGEIDGTQVEVLAGLEAGEEVACGPLDRVVDGDWVEVVP